MNATEKNIMAMIFFFALILWMAIYYSTVLEERFQTPLTYFQNEAAPDRIAGII